MTSTLTRDDVTRLLEDPSPDARAAAALKLSGTMEDQQLTAEETEIARDIVQLMARDAATIVREALAVNLKSSTHLPHDVALQLARDVDSVAIPILEFSDVLNDADLIDLVRNVPESKQTAIARRSGLSEPVSGALVDTESKAVVQTLVANEKADIGEAALHKVVDQFGDDEDFHGPLATRSELPVTVAERLVAKVSDQLKEYLVAHHELSADTASELVLNARERATVNLVSDGTDEADVEKLAAQLAKSGRLTPSLILRSLCVGDLALFEAGVAQLAEVPLVNARVLIHDQGSLGLKALYKKAGLPEALFPAYRLALQILSATDFKDADYDRESYSRTMLERILSQCEDLRQDDAEYLLRKLNDLAPAHLGAA